MNYKKRKQLKALRQQIQDDLLSKFSKAAWNFAYSVLWPNHFCDADEKSVCIDSIKIYFEERVPNLPEAFIEFCERVMMAKWYVQASPERYLPAPAFWLNYCNEKGFKGTAKWYLNLEEKRKVNPEHLMGLKALAVAYLDYVFDPTQQSFIEGRELLIALDEPKLLQLFNSSVINHHYIAA